jgi:hypothetical protein
MARRPPRLPIGDEHRARSAVLAPGVLCLRPGRRAAPGSGNRCACQPTQPGRDPRWLTSHPANPAARNPAGRSMRNEQPGSSGTTTKPVGPVRATDQRLSVTPPVAVGMETHSTSPGWAGAHSRVMVRRPHSERAGNGDQHVYCEAHAHRRHKTIRLPLVRRMRLRLGERPNPSASLPGSWRSAPRSSWHPTWPARGCTGWPICSPATPERLSRLDLAVLDN